MIIATRPRLPVSPELHAALLGMAVAHRNASFCVHGMAPRAAKTSRKLMRHYALRARGKVVPS